MTLQDPTLIVDNWEIKEIIFYSMRIISSKK